MGQACCHRMFQCFIYQETPIASGTGIFLEDFRSSEVDTVRHALSQSTEEELRLNIILCGECGVGKTSLRNRWLEGRFIENVIPTVGVDFDFKMLRWVPHGSDGSQSSQRLKVNVYDTSGKAEFRQMNASYLRAFEAILFVFDVSRLNTFVDLKESIEQQIIQNSLSKNREAMILIGCKADLPANEREVQYETGLEAANSLDMPYLEVSCVSGKGINDAFMHICQRVMESRSQEQRRSSKTVAKNIENIEVKDEQKDLKFGSLRNLFFATKFSTQVTKTPMADLENFRVPLRLIGNQISLILSSKSNSISTLNSVSSSSISTPQDVHRVKSELSKDQMSCDDAVNDINSMEKVLHGNPNFDNQLSMNMVHIGLESGA